MQKLIEGLHRFQTEVFSNQRERFERLADGQHPLALFITCSDSRISPNLLTQTDPGELFILRNAGNIIPPYGAIDGGEAATIEFALTALNVHDIVVCGHSQCGAMKGLVDPRLVENMPSVQRWLRHAESTRRIISENYQHIEGPARVAATVQENVLVQLENLRTHPSVASRLSRRDLRLHAWVYKLEDGSVFSYDPAAGQFQVLQAQSANSDATPLNAASI